jgi:two-component system sensor histidine kinase FlrB
MREIENRNNSLLIQVVDRGKGVAPEIIDSIFDPFFTTNESGTGLGLCIVENIVAAHKGSVRLRNNEDGPGCTAEIELPLREKVKDDEKQK